MTGIINKIKQLESKLKTKIIVDGTDTYICKSVIGTLDTDSKWAITKIDADGNSYFPIDITDNTSKFAFGFLPANATSYSYI